MKLTITTISKRVSQRQMEDLPFRVEAQMEDLPFQVEAKTWFLTKDSATASSQGSFIRTRCLKGSLAPSITWFDILSRP